MTSCPICKIKLIPIVYGVLNPEMLQAQARGEILIGQGRQEANSYCPLCEEAYNDYTT